MGSRRLHLIVSNFLVIFILAACVLSTAGAPSGSAGSTTAVPTKSEPAPSTAAPATALGASAGGGCANAYYPVPSGATWSYASSGSSSVGDYTYTRTITAVSDTGFTTSDQYSTGVNAAIKWSCQNGNLAALDAGSSSFGMTTSKITMTSDSVTADGYNIPAAFDSGKTWSEKVTVIGTMESNGKKVGTSQIVSQISCTGAGPDTVTVPAGKFDAVKAACIKNVAVSAIVQKTPTPLASNQESITYWYAKGVGFVKSVATGGSDNETVVLTQYKLP